MALVMGRGSKSFEVHTGESLGCCQQNVGRRMVIKGHSGEGSDRNEQIIGIWGKDNPCCKVANNLAELCSSISRKIELLSHEIGYLAEGIPKQNVEAMVWFFLNAYSKM